MSEYPDDCQDLAPPYTYKTAERLAALGNAVKGVAAAMGRGEPPAHVYKHALRARRAARALESKILTDWARHTATILAYALGFGIRIVMMSVIGWALASWLVPLIRI